MSTYKIGITLFVEAGNEDEARSTIIDNAKTYLSDTDLEVELYRELLEENNHDKNRAHTR